MGRKIGATNRSSTAEQFCTNMTSDERLELLAGLIVNKIRADQQNTKALVAELGGHRNEPATTN